MAGLIVFAIFLTVLAVKIQIREYAHKQKVGYNFTRGDFVCTPKNATCLSLVAAVVGFINAVTGIGPGIMLYAILLQLDLHPRVAGNSSQWLGVLISLASSICMLIYGMIPIDYAVVINSFTMMGTLYGMQLQE